MRVSAEECGKIARAMLRWDRRAAKEIAGLILKGPRSRCSASPGPSGEGAAPSSLRAEAEERAKKIRKGLKRIAQRQKMARTITGSYRDGASRAALSAGGAAIAPPRSSRGRGDESTGQVRVAPAGVRAGTGCGRRDPAAPNLPSLKEAYALDRSTIRPAQKGSGGFGNGPAGLQGRSQPWG